MADAHRHVVDGQRLDRRGTNKGGDNLDRQVAGVVQCINTNVAQSVTAGAFRQSKRVGGQPAHVAKVLHVAARRLPERSKHVSVKHDGVAVSVFPSVQRQHVQFHPNDGV